MNHKELSLQSNGVLLKAFANDDLENIFRGLSHPDVIRYYGVSYPTLEATRAQLQFFEQLETNGTGKWWAVYDHSSTIFYGACGFSHLDQHHKKAELGFWLLPEYWGKGIVSTAVSLVCGYGFNRFKLHRIEAIVEAENINSKKVMERMQFNFEGRMKECEYKNGRFISLDFYAKLNPSAG